MDFNSLEEFEKWAKEHPKEAVSSSEGETADLECPNCGERIVLELSRLNDVKCTSCGANIIIED